MQDTAHSLWRAFWANSKMLRCKAAPLQCRLRTWDRISAGILEYRCTRWPLCKRSLQIIDSAQFKIAVAIAGMKPHSFETPEGFSVWRGRQLSCAIKQCSRKWSLRWAIRVQSWLEHCSRHPEVISAQLLRCQDEAWLREHRRAFVHLSANLSISAGLTGTRAGAGKPIRWLDQKWSEYTIRDNPDRCRLLTASQAANMLLALRT